MADGMYSLADVFDKALGNVEFNNEPVELSEKEKAKHERWLKKQEEKEQRVKQMQVQMDAALDARKKKAQQELEAKMTEKRSAYAELNAASSYAQIQEELSNCKSREAREDLREKELQAWMLLIDNLTDTNRCCPDNYVTVTPERFVRSFPENKKFLFSHGMPLRPSFALKDRDNPKISYLAWTDITPETIQLEFGSQIPSRRSPNGERELIGEDKKRFFSVRYWNVETAKFESGIFIYERYDCEFEAMLKKLNDFFGAITTGSKKKYQDLRWALDKKAPGVFNRGRTEESIQKVLNDYLRAGGLAKDITEQSIRHGDAVVFSKNVGTPNAYKYILVNSSHYKSSVIDPDVCLADGVSGFGRDPNTNKIFTYLSYHMALLEFDMPNHKLTIVHGA